MKFLADVNIPKDVVKYLTSIGHEVLEMKNVDKLASDTEIVSLAKNENRVLLSLDKDFIFLLQSSKYQVPCIIFRLKGQSPYNLVHHLDEFIKSNDSSTIERSLTIIREEDALINIF